MSERVIWLTRYGGPSDEPTPIDNIGILNIPRWQAGVRYLASLVAPLRIKVIREEGDDKVEQKSHALHVLLNRKMNNFAGPVRTKETWIQHGLNWGNGYLKVIRDGIAGPVRELVTVSPQRIIPFRVDGVKFFYDNFDNKAYSDADFLHIMLGPSDDGVCGHDPTYLLTQTFETATALQRHTFSYFNKGTTVNGVIEIPGDMTEDQIRTLANSWLEHHGVDNAGKPGIIPFGGKWVNATANNEQAQLSQLREAAGKELLTILMPALAIFEPKDVSRLELCRYLIEQIEDEMTLKLLTPREVADGYSIRVATETLKRGDIKDAIEKVNAGMETANEARAAWDMPPLDGGEKLRMPINVAKEINTPGTTVGDNTTARATSPAAYSALAPVIRDAVERVEQKRVKAVNNRKGKEGFTDWLMGFGNQQGAYLRESLASIQLAAAAHGSVVSFDRVARDYEEAVIGETEYDLIEAIHDCFISSK
jgi:HK97 family phage portal protein